MCLHGYFDVATIIIFSTGFLVLSEKKKTNKAALNTTCICFDKTEKRVLKLVSKRMQDYI